MQHGKGKKRGEYLLYEPNLRMMLTNMYNALRSTENSRKILEKTPDEIDQTEYGGDDLARNSMKGLCEWLSDMSVLTKDDDTYRSVFLRPVRAAAKMRLQLSGMRTRSSDVEALVFAQMPYYDTEYGVQRIILSTVVPSLQAPMSVRVSTGRESFRHGYHVFKNCQPMPLVNRIRQTDGVMERSDRMTDLSEFDFLYTALEDIASLGRSLEMENFCEVPSQDAEPRQHLAAPFVTFGTVEMVSGPAVHLRSLDGQHHAKLIAADQVSELSEELRGFERKPVRLLGAQWYEPNKYPDSVPENPALYCVEAVDDLGALRLQEACGRVRVRGSVHASQIPEGLRRQLLKRWCVSVEKERVSYARRRAHDGVSAHFFNAHDGICKMRTKLSSIQITEDQVIDQQKSDVHGLAAVLTSRKYRALGALLMDFVMQMDARAEYDESAVAGTRGVASDHAKNMARLRSFGIMEKADNSWNLTKKGRDVARRVSKNLAGRILGNLPALISPDSLMAHGIPPSLALFLLRERALGEYRPARANAQTTEVYWILQQTKLDEEAGAKFEDFKLRVLEAMGSVSHSSTAAGIAGGVRASAFTTGLLLSELSKVADSPVRPDGGSWEYTIVARVRGVFERGKQEIMSEDDVAGRIVVGLARKAEVRLAIESLVRAGTVARIEDGAFTHNSDLESKRGARMDEIVKDAVMDALSSVDGVEDDDLIRALVRLLGDAGMTGEDTDKIGRARGVLNRLEDEGAIWRSGSRILKS